jgi:hypothetical protein
MATVIPGRIQEQSGSNRIGRASEAENDGSRLAKVVEFLATDLSDYVTEAVVPIDGVGPGIASHPPFLWPSVSSSIVDMGIELSLNGDAC